jgi:hypothetical protein
VSISVLAPVIFKFVAWATVVSFNNHKACNSLSACSEILAAKRWMLLQQPTLVGTEENQQQLLQRLIEWQKRC